MLTSTQLVSHLTQLQHTHGWQLEHGYYAEGGVFEFLPMARALFSLASHHRPTTVCEIGFNTGVYYYAHMS